jgi:hypothetical protein
MHDWDELLFFCDVLQYFFINNINQIQPNWIQILQSIGQQYFSQPQIRVLKKASPLEKNIAASVLFHYATRGKKECRQ